MQAHGLAIERLWYGSEADCLGVEAFHHLSIPMQRLKSLDLTINLEDHLGTYFRAALPTFLSSAVALERLQLNFWPGEYPSNVFIDDDVSDMAEGSGNYSAPADLLRSIHDDAELTLPALKLLSLGVILDVEATLLQQVLAKFRATLERLQLRLVR